MRSFIWHLETVVCATFGGWLDNEIVATGKTCLYKRPFLFTFCTIYPYVALLPLVLTLPLSCKYMCHSQSKLLQSTSFCSLMGPYLVHPDHLRTNLGSVLIGNAASSSFATICSWNHCMVSGRLRKTSYSEILISNFHEAGLLSAHSSKASICSGRGMYKSIWYG